MNSAISNDAADGTAPTLGVVAISYNEEQDLPGFLAGLLSWVDEIVIVDDGSDDGTGALAEAAGEKVNFIVSPRQGGEYFSHQRNKGIDAATSDWLLHMDIDERVTAALAREIAQAIRSGKYDAYRFRRLNFFLHRPMRGGGWQDWNLVHLARREVLRFGGMFHEDCIVTAPEERIGQLQERMWHLNDRSYLHRIRKSVLYCQEQANRLRESDRTIRWWHFILLPAADFLGKYFKRGGYRDGTPGLLFAMHAASARFKACALVWDEQNAITRESIEQQVRDLASQNDRE